jgi:DNA (cytosine-5)-methyltransferase 1
VPPYDPGKFPNKWRKMEPDEPARTLMAHLGKDSYSHIHYDSDQARVLSVREAARLQSFPDGFKFSGTMNPAFRQIGNAVPPLLAHALAEPLLAAIGATRHSAVAIPHETKVRTSAAV